MNSMKRELKRAKLFEVQKITKRIRALKRRRGTDSQLEKNQRKVQRLQHDLELVKDINIARLCLRIEARDDDIIQLAQLKEPPTDSREKAEWRLITSKGVRESLSEIAEVDELATKREEKRQLDQRVGGEIPLGVAEEVEEGDSDAESIHTAMTAAVVSSDQSGDALGSVFVASLSASSRSVMERRKEKRAQKTRKKNRLGQRSRRRIWEEKYGSKAKHLGKTVSKRKRHMEADKTQVPKVAKERGEARKSQVSTHPSWVAKRQLKTGIEEFQGQRIVFDSD